MQKGSICFVMQEYLEHCLLSTSRIARAPLCDHMTILNANARDQTHHRRGQR